MKILITGANGQLGSEIKQLVEQYPNFDMIFATRSILDISNKEAVEAFIINNKIKAIVNCAAYTAVDKAETEPEMAASINGLGVENLVNAIAKVEGRIIHVSTDYVFDGTNFTPYDVNDKVSAIGVYGRTKLEGETKLTQSKVNGIVIRTSWVYSSFGNNFVKTMLRLGNERSELGVIFDQVGTPTYARDLAKVCLDILSNNENLNSENGIYHYSNEGVASWYDFAIAIMEIGKIDCKVKPIETKEYPTPAKRPNYSILNKAQIKKDFKISIPYWRDSLKECIQKLK